MTAHPESHLEPAAKAGDTVRIHFTCRFEDGTEYSTTRNRDPLEFVIGTTRIIPGLQDAVLGMRPGETKTATIPPDRAYGPYHDEMTATLDLSMAPEDVDLEPGVSIRVEHADGHESDVVVTEVGESTFKVDGNHPLAGRSIVIDIELLSIEED